MNAVLRALIPLVLLASGIGAGVMLATVIGIVPMFLAQPYDGYVRSVQFLWPRYDPFMPIINGFALTLDVVLAVLARTTAARGAFTAAALAMAAVMTISVVKNVPINRYVKSLDPDRLPADWAARDPRVRWRNWNLLRTACALAGLVANVMAAAALI